MENSSVYIVQRQDYYFKTGNETMFYASNEQEAQILVDKMNMEYLAFNRLAISYLVKEVVPDFYLGKYRKHRHKAVVNSENLKKALAYTEQCCIDLGLIDISLFVHLVCYGPKEKYNFETEYSKVEYSYSKVSKYAIQHN